jgi:predicted MPP superfamily phosphohydrolase
MTSAFRHPNPEGPDVRPTHDHRRRISRRRMLAASAAAAVGLPVVAGVDGLLVTPHRLDVSRHAFGESSPSSPRMRIVQVSDLHIRSFGATEARLIDAISAARPDVIVHTGDMLESPRGLGPLTEFLERCPDVASFAIAGNWEYASRVPLPEIERLCTRAGIEWLLNRSVVVPHGGTAVRLTGLDDLRGGRPDPDVALAGAETVPNHVVLAHCPASRDRVMVPARHAADLMLSGHTHGGQVAPFGITLILPKDSGGYVAGWYGQRDHAGRPPLYVSRGIGTSVIRVRIGSVPELAVFEWGLA